MTQQDGHQQVLNRMVFPRKLGVSYTRYIVMLVCDTTGRAPAGLEQNGISSQAGGKIFSDTFIQG